MRAAPRANHDRHRSREAERARTSNDQHRDCVHQRVRQSRLWTEQEPRHERHPGNENDSGHEPGRYFIGKALYGSATALRLPNHLNDSREQGFGAHPLGAHDERTGAVDGRADDRTVREFFPRESIRR